jgi:hypothetical protein
MRSFGVRKRCGRECRVAAGWFVVALVACSLWALGIRKFYYEPPRPVPVARERRPGRVAVIALLVILSVPFPPLWGFWLVQAATRPRA